MKKIILQFRRAWLFLFVSLLSISIMQAQTAYVANYNSDDISIIDITSGALIQTIPAGNGPAGVAISPNNNNVYITSQFTDEILVLDAVTNTIIDTITAGSDPFGITITPDGSEIYVAEFGATDVRVINTATNMITDTIPVGSGPIGLSVSPDGTEVYVANNTSSNVMVINTATKTVTNTIAVGVGPRDIAHSPDGTKVYVSIGGAGSVFIIDPVTKNITDTISVGTLPYGLAVSPDGSEVYVANYNSASVSVIDVMTNGITTIPVGTNPFSVAFTVGGDEAYITNFGSDNVSVINTSTKTITNTIGVGDGPIAFGNFISNPIPATALNFDGINDRIQMQGLDLDGAFTIETWVKPVKKFDFSTIISNKFGGLQEPGFIFSINDFQDSSGVLVLETQGVKVITSSAITWDIWQHIAVTYDGGTDVKIYIDGVEQPLDASSAISLDSSNFTTFIGDLSVYFMNAHFEGDMDEMRIWDYPRTNGEILNYMACELSGMEPGLTAYYDFNEGNIGENNVADTILMDLSFNGNEGTLEDFALTGTVSNWVEGQSLDSCNVMPAYSLDFDGVDDHVILPDGFAQNFTNGTVSGAAWVYLDTADVWGTIIKNWGNSNWGSFHFGIENDSMELAIEIWDGVNPRIFVISPDSFPVQQWVHAAFTADGDSIRLYENGVQKASAAYSGQLHTDFPATYIGAKPNDAGDGVDPFNPGYWDGRIDELSMWNRGLSPAEIRAIASCKPLATQSGLIAYYSFDQGFVDGNNTSDTILTDDVNGMYNGVLTNFALTGPTSNWAEGNELTSCPELVNASTLNFDGINDHIVLPDSFANNFTNGIISGAAWAYLDTISVWGTIIKNWGNSNYGSFHFGLENDSMEMAIEIWDGSSSRLFVISPDSFPVREWVHVAFVADGDSVRLFENGIQKAVSPYSGQLFTDFPATYIGAKPNDAGDGVDPFNPGYWNGDLDDISMWNRALTKEEIESLAQCKPMADEEGLVAYYGFDQGLVDFNNAGDTILYDDKGMYNGVLKNFALDGTVSNWTGDGEILDDCFVPSPPVSIEEFFSTETGMTIAPNPAVDVLNLKLEAKKNTEMTMYVYDLSGRMIMSKAGKVVKGPQELRLDIDNLSSGIYFLTVQIGDDHYSKKFIKTDN